MYDFSTVYDEGGQRFIHASFLHMRSVPSLQYKRNTDLQYKRNTGLRTNVNTGLCTNVIPVYGTNVIPVYSTNVIPVYSTNVIPVYSTNVIIPIYSTNVIPVYSTQVIPVYSTNVIPSTYASHHFKTNSVLTTLAKPAGPRHWSIKDRRFSWSIVSLTSWKTSLMFSVSMAVVKWWKRGLARSLRRESKLCNRNAFTSSMLCGSPVKLGM